MHKEDEIKDTEDEWRPERGNLKVREGEQEDIKKIRREEGRKRRGRQGEDHRSKGKMK